MDSLLPIELHSYLLSPDLLSFAQWNCTDSICINHCLFLWILSILFYTKPYIFIWWGTRCRQPSLCTVSRQDSTGLFFFHPESTQVMPLWTLAACAYHPHSRGQQIHIMLMQMMLHNFLPWKPASHKFFFFISLWKIPW